MATKDEQLEAEKQLTKALFMLIEGFRALGFDNDYILRKTNLICEQFITEDGEFTEEYLALARQAIEMRKHSMNGHAPSAQPIIVIDTK